MAQFMINGKNLAFRELWALLGPKALFILPQKYLLPRWNLGVFEYSDQLTIVEGKVIPDEFFRMFSQAFVDLAQNGFALRFYFTTPTSRGRR